MNTPHSIDTLDPRTVEQTTKNISLLGAFLREVVADPAILDQLPSGATLIFIPDDDPDLAQSNLALAEKAAAAGKDVWVSRMSGDQRVWRQFGPDAARMRTQE